MEAQLKVQQVPSGYIMPEKIYSNICIELLNTSAKLRFIKKSFALIEENNQQSDEIYGADAIINDIRIACDNIYDVMTNEKSIG